MRSDLQYRKTGESRDPALKNAKARDQTKRRRRGKAAGYFALTWQERALEAGMFIALDGAVSFLFYRSFFAMLLLAPSFCLFRKEYRQGRIRQKKQRMRQEFMTGMQMVGTALRAGYAMENTFAQALPELRRIYGEDAFICGAFSRIISKLSVRESPESALTALGEETDIEEIRSFAQVFRAARRTGGDMMAIVRNTVSGLSEKEETRLEIETMLSGRQMEQKIMSIVPLLILAYTGISSPGLMACMYHNPAGITVMTICLAIYAAAFIWGRKIMDIEV